MPKSKTLLSRTEKEAQKRFEAALRDGLTTTPTPLKEKPNVKKAAKRKQIKRNDRMAFGVVSSPGSMLVSLSGSCCSAGR